MPAQLYVLPNLVEKVCYRCKQSKSLSEFDIRYDDRNKRSSWCKPCRRKWQGEYQKRNRRKVNKAAILRYHKNPEKFRAKWIKQNYGISIAQYDELLIKQNGACAICRTKSPKLVIDHNHSSGKVRGLLCRKCNSGIGLLKDNSLLLRAAITYLEKDGSG